MSSEGKVVLSYHDTLLRESDVELLKGPYWLNDIVLSFWFEFLEKDVLAEYTKDIAFVSPQVCQFLKLSGPQECGSMLEPLDLSNKKLALLPINDSELTDAAGGSHWSLLTFSSSDGFLHYDSSKGSNRWQAQSMASALSPHLAWNLTSNPMQEGTCPSQENSYDCGIHVLCNAERACQRLISAGALSILPLLDTNPSKKRNHILKTISSLIKCGK